MRTLEHRRHSRRDPGGIHLNSAGRALARSVGGELPAFDRVVTSPRPRAVETAVAMGRTVDARIEALGEMGDEIGARVDESDPRTFADFLDLVGRSERVSAYAAGQVALWRNELARVREGGRVLMISHGGMIELGAAFALGDGVRAWGPTLGYVEGVRLTRDGERWTSGEVLRVREPGAPRSHERRAHARGDASGVARRVDGAQ